MVRIYATLPADRIERAIERREALSLVFLPEALEDLLAMSKRPRMAHVASLPEPTPAEARAFYLRHSLIDPEDAVPVRDLVLMASVGMGREAADVVAEMFGLARLPDAEQLPRATDKNFNPRLMLVAFWPISGEGDDAQEVAR